VEKFIKVEEILSEALALPPQNRASLAEKLNESLYNSNVAEISPAWREEIRKRCREVDNGMVELKDAEDVFTRAYSALI
jgi:putative addiction module component (TIGR02574 family)